ncbi:MAG: Arc family DNA-binding protein [Bacteroidales bacterium]
MNKKKSFVLRLNSEMYDALEKWAADEFRSTNGQLEWIISDALKKAGRKPKREERGEREGVKDVRT